MDERNKIFGYLYEAVKKLQMFDRSCKEILLSISERCIWQSRANRLWGYYSTVNKHQVHSHFTVWFGSLSVIQVRLSSLDFVVNRLFMKLFKTSNIVVVKCCQGHFGFNLPSVIWCKRVKKFENKFYALGVY